MKKVAITGGSGFLGWHTAVRLRAEYGIEARVIGRSEFTDAAQLSCALQDADTIIHLAGVNRAESDQAVEDSNVEIAERLAGVVATGPTRHVVYCNSIHCVADSPYGRGKARAAELLRHTVRSIGGTFADVVLPNVFGEHGRPRYNSFVATFCYEVTRGGSPVVIDDNEVPLLHAQDAAHCLIEAAREREDREYAPAGKDCLVSDVLARILAYHELYVAGQVPRLENAFDVDLFNTYRSYMFPGHFPFHPAVNSDDRGELYEAMRAHGGTGQVFVSSTLPSAVRGEHYHLRKVERFFVLEGFAEIALRRILDDEVIRFRISGDEHGFVDMPTLWAHSIRNIGDDRLLTLFWTNQLLDPDAPDTYREAVE